MTELNVNSFAFMSLCERNGTPVVPAKFVIDGDMFDRFRA
jgi:hypothetical protein